MGSDEWVKFNWKISKFMIKKYSEVVKQKLVVGLGWLAVAARFAGVANGVAQAQVPTLAARSAGRGEAGPGRIERGCDFGASEERGGDLQSFRGPDYLFEQVGRLSQNVIRTLITWE